MLRLHISPAILVSQSEAMYRNGTLLADQASILFLAVTDDRFSRLQHAPF